ncbi:MAG: TolC family protein [Candidatus Aminicenantales bacterium]
MRNRIALIPVFLFLLLPLNSAQVKKEYTLPEIIALGLEKNPRILAKIQEVESKKAAYEASRLFLNPELEYEKGQGKSAETQEKINTGALSLSQTIENPFKRKHRIRMTEKDWKASQHALDYKKLEITYEIKNLFFAVLLQEKLVEIASKNLESIKKTQLIEKRVALGESKELESIKLKVEVLKAQNELKRRETALKLARDNLNKFLGKVLPPDFSLSGKLGYKALTIDEQSLIERASAIHPLLKMNREEMEGLQSNIQFIKWQRIPDPELKAFIENEIDGKNKGVGISIEVPIWNLRTKEIAEAEGLFLKKKQELKALELELETEVKSGFKQLRLAEQKIDLFHSGLLDQASESLKLARISYEQGEISLMDFLDSQRTYNDVIKDYYQALYEWNSYKASLEKSTGVEIK